MSVEDFTPLVDNVVDSNADDLCKLSRFLWEHPELALQEFKAHNMLCEFLEQRGFKVQRSHLLDTAFRAEFDAPGGTDGIWIAVPAPMMSMAGPTVALMVEYDALPDMGHACGHNLIAEASVGAAVAAMEIMKTTPAARGKLVVLGTPAEENHCGKELLVQKGAFKGIDAAMMVHPIHQDSLRGGFNASQKIAVHYRGKAAHAGAVPWEGVNALDAAVASYVNVSLLRQQLKPACRIHGIFTESGKNCSVIPDTSTILYQVRGETVDDLTELVTRAEGCFSAAALSTGCTATMEKCLMYKDVIHNMSLTKIYRKHGLALGVKFTDEDLSFIEPCGASTDAGNVSYVVPTIHPLYRIRAGGKNHTLAFAEASNSAEAQPPTLRVAKILALTALDLFTDPALVSQVKVEFAEWKAGRHEGCQTSPLAA